MIALNTNYKYLFKNIGLLTLSNFATKLISFFLVPLYTAVLTTEQYGTYDLFNTTVGVLIPILSLNILEAVLRFGMDKNYSKDAIITVGSKWLGISTCFVFLVIVVNHFFTIIPILEKYKIYFFFMFFTQTLSGIVTAYSRGTDHVASLSVSSIIASVITIGCNILFLIPFKWGLVGYFWANILGPLVQCVYLIVRLKAWRHLNLKKKFVTQEKEMISYSSPLIANSISWWINNVSDRYIVTLFCGVAANGIYSVSTKIPSILNILQTIFNQAWDLSAVRDFDPADKSGFFRNTYRAYNCLMVILCSLIIASDRILAKFLYLGKFYTAWKYVPFLTIAIVFGALTGYLGGFFTATKDSKAYATSTIYGAVVNIILNFILIPIIGTLGASISTAVCYIVVWLIRFFQSRKYIKIKINLIRDIISYLLLILQTCVILFLPNNVLMYVIQLGLVAIIMLLYKNDIILIVSKILDMLRKSNEYN